MELNELTQQLNTKWAEIQNLLKDFNAQQKPPFIKPTQTKPFNIWSRFHRFKVQGTIAKSELSTDCRFRLENISLEAVHKIRKITDEDYKTVKVPPNFRFDNRKTLLIVPQKLPRHLYPDSSYFFEMAAYKKPKTIDLDNKVIDCDNLAMGDTVIADISVVTHDGLNSYSCTPQDKNKIFKIYDLLSLKEKYEPLDCYRRTYYGDWEKISTFEPIRAVYMHSIKVMKCKKDTGVL